jgi:hypothetical protein
MTEEAKVSEEVLIPSATGTVIHESKFSEVTIEIPFPESYVYSNCTAFSISPMDSRISFAEALPDGTSHARAGVGMSADHAAYLAMQLLRQLETFEKQFGPIRTPAWRKWKDKRSNQSSPAEKIEGSAT